MALLTQAEFARQQGFTRGYVTKLINKGIIKLVNKKVDSAAAIKAIEKNTDPSKHRPSKAKQISQPAEILPAGGQPGAVDFVTARTMREAFRAKLAKLDFEERSGQLTDATKVKNDAFKAGRIIRDELLAIPDRLADVLAAEDDAGEVRKIIFEELELVLNRLCK
ncbi:hypothetical protein [Endozoicomonas sp. SCSIO W0465]|uniref:hypothetical protein n=1 Tax=Endozoicomonas sp. SCSIO W0465 TaxID=2918516 RepID=UPI0020758722|nr:hypothetical protein [Endozoicomonas sp. SCSIO W0465]USE38040.1 hypothetical protein MJO57_07640 [Endozoicomonas sp. SCSIO W0465]